jgi:hypothetical protein
VEVVLDKEGCPRLWELNVNGRAFRAGSTLDTLVVCHHCGITKFPNPQDLTVDVARWDGSDFFNLDMNPNMLFVTERVRALFLRERFSNCEFQPVPKLP